MFILQIKIKNITAVGVFSLPDLADFHYHSWQQKQTAGALSVEKIMKTSIAKLAHGIGDFLERRDIRTLHIVYITVVFHTFPYTGSMNFAHDMLKS